MATSGSDLESGRVSRSSTQKQKAMADAQAKASLEPLETTDPIFSPTAQRKRVVSEDDGGHESSQASETEEEGMQAEKRRHEEYMLVQQRRRRQDEKLERERVIRLRQEEEQLEAARQHSAKVQRELEAGIAGVERQQLLEAREEEERLERESIQRLRALHEEREALKGVTETDEEWGRSQQQREDNELEQFNAFQLRKELAVQEHVAKLNREYAGVQTRMLVVVQAKEDAQKARAEQEYALGVETERAATNTRKLKERFEVSRRELEKQKTTMLSDREAILVETEKI